MILRCPVPAHLLLILLGASAVSLTLGESSADARLIGLTTAYQTEPIVLTINGEARELRRIYLKVDLHQGTGTLQLDGTTCSQVDAWGEVADCAPGIYPPEKVRLAQVKMADPTGHGRKLYAILEGSPEERLFLVVPTRTCDAYRLTVETRGGKVTRVITMEFDESMCAPASPGTKRVCAQPRHPICAAIRARCRLITK